ncbi:centrosomal protein of 295 kDa isoform X2 [Ctenopharyngodon idella]|uniref:centrosomal protein of 295 kDa isoform X2 n=1 Tax=Ctenopharyngodon idella TaxID=7959 RepID=UPI00222FC71A|nr:centrosomal protein of 295 kDa isoform X2 [Ctenopharyngodon idella]
MRRKSSSASRLRLSPNEEAQLVREELESRRKLRLQQVREQERYIARQVRRQVQERRQQQLQMLADSLQLEWQQQHTHKLQALSRLYQHSLKSVGHGHRSAQENEPDLEALAQKSVERQERAEERHREALRELSARRHEEEQQRCRHIEARRKALVEEKKRAVKVASLPPPPPNPVESIGKTTPRPLKSAAAERFSVTHCHMPQTAVERETHTEQQPSAQQAAALEFQRLEELRREEARDRQEQLEKARLRGNHALRREQNTQDRARLLCELERLQQADLLRRRQTVNSVPAQIFQPLYRQEELRDEQQRDLEIAFQDVYTEERKVKGDLVLQLVPEPLPPMSAASHDEELDVTLDPECAPEGEEPGTSVTEAPDPGRRALRRLLDRIRSQRARQRAAATTLTSHEGDAEVEVLSVETGSLSSQEKAPEGSSEEQTPSPTHTDDGADISDEAVVAGTLLPPEERDQPMPASAASERRATHEELLLRQQQEQLAVLEELEEQRRELEQRLRETQQMNETLQEAAQRRPVIQESAELPEPPPEVDSDDLHTQRLHQYQQRLLQQNRLHKKSVEEARRRLQEYQRSLKLRYGIGSTTAARATLQQPSVSSETVSDRTRSALPHIFNPEACAAHPGNAPASQFPARPVQSQQAHFSPPKPIRSDSSRPSVLSEGSPLEARAEDGQEVHVPLPPPAVVLELLRSRLHQAACAVPQHADITGSVMAPSSGPAGPVQREEEADRQETVRRHMRRQRDALQALITADVQASVSDSSGTQADQMVLNTLLNAIEEANRPPTAPIQQNRATLTLLNDGVYDPAPVNRGRVKPPVSRPPARLAFLRQMEQHELSAIQEVDTPVNVSLDTELQSAADVSESSSASLPALASEGSHSPSDRSQVTGRISRMSWRETLLQDSTPSRGPSSVKHQQEFSAGCPSSVEPDYLSSTTISTGSYFTSDHEPDDSHLCIDPDECGLSPADRSQEMSGSVQQIIDKYSKELNASLRHAGVHSGAVNSECQSWSSVLHEEVRAHDGDAAQISGSFLPLQPHPDIDSSSSSSSSRNVVRDDQSSRAQGWSETVNRILERLSDQLSIRHGEQAHSSAPSEPSRLSSSLCTDQDRASDSSHFTNESLQSMMNGAGHISNYSDSHSSAELQDQSASREWFDGGQSVLSQLIGRASDIGSSQVFDQSSALAGGAQEVTRSTAANPVPALHSIPDRLSEIRSLMSPALQHPDEDRSAFTDAPHDDASDLFLPLPSDVTNNESVDCSTALCIPLEAEKCGTDASVDDASDWLESSDQSLPSLQHLRTDTLIQSQADLQISMEQLSLTHESLCETDVVADPTVMDISRMPCSPHKTCLQEESLTPTVQLPSQEVTSAIPQHQSAVEENVLSELLERAQAAGDVKGILEESTISFISLPESTLQDPDLTEDSGSEPQEVTSDHSEGKVPSRTVEDNSQSEEPEPTFPHAVMLLEFQCSPAQRQRRDGLAQRSALRAAQIKARHSTTRLEQHVSRATGRTALRSDMADGLKSVAEVRICTAAQRRVEEAEMHRRTERLYSQLEEVKRQKEFRSRQESYAKNREKARDFQRKTLEKLRARVKP